MTTTNLKLALLAATLGISAAGQPARPALNALWVYSVSSLPNAISDEPTRNTLIQNSVASGVSTLYVSVYQSKPNSEKRYMYEDSDIADLIAKAHSQGMQVYAAYGDSDWPALGCDASAFPMLRMAEVIAFNLANPTAKFDGVILDVEPSGTPDYRDLLALYQCFQQQAQSNGMGLAVAISAFWNDVVTFGQTTEEAYKQIVDLDLNQIVVMGYRNYAGTSDCTQQDGIVCLDHNVVAYANSVSRANAILIGLDTDNPLLSGSLPKETFFSMGQTAMNSVAQSVSSQFATASQSVGGFAVHNYRNAYLSGQVPGWPATNPQVSAGTPQFTAAGVTNAASFAAGSLAPGELIAIFGTNLGPAAPQTIRVMNDKLTTNLGGVQVLFDGNAAPMVLASSGQVNTIVPFGIATNSTTNIQIVYNGTASAPVMVPTVESAPGIFTADSSGSGQAAALNQDYSFNSSSDPEPQNSVVTIYMTGAGQLTPAANDGSVNADPSALGQITAPVTAQIGGYAATVLYAGSSLGIVSGVIQVNLLIPYGVPSGTEPVTVQIGGGASQSGVTIAVQ